MAADIIMKRRRIRSGQKAVKPTDIPNKAQLTTTVNTTTTTAISQAGAAGWLRMNQTLTGTKNGANKTFTLPHLLMSSTEPVVYWNYTRLEPKTSPGLGEYSRNGQVLTFGFAPASGDSLVVDQMTPQAPNPVLDEEPTGDKDFSNTAFTLKYEPSAPQDVALYHGTTRVKLTYGTPGTNEFSLSGKTITMGTAPRSVENFRADYSARRFGVIRWGDEMWGTVNGVNKVFTLDEVPYEDEIAVYYNGIRLEKVASSPTAVEYTRVGKTVTFGVAPTASDTLYADYVTPYGGVVLHVGPGWWIGTECGDMIATTQSEFEQV
jgi:hypothetical protein